MLVDVLHGGFLGYIAYYHNSHQVWPVPLLVKSPDGSGIKGFDDAVDSYGKALSIFGSLEILRVNFFEHAFLSAFSKPALFQDNRPFAVDVFIEVGYLVCPVFQYLKTFVKV